MFGKDFRLNEQTLEVIEQIGEHMPGGFFIYRAEGNEELLYANRAVWEIFGCDSLESFKAHTGFTFKGMLHPEDYASVSASIVDQISGSQDDLDYVEYRIIRRDGQVRWLDDYGHYVRSDAYGGLYYVFVSDITEKRMRMEDDKAVRMAVIEALSRAYNTMWLIHDVQTESFSLFRGSTDADSPHAAPIDAALKRMRYSQAKAEYIDTFVTQSDRARLRDQLSLQNLVANTPARGVYPVEFKRLQDGEERYYRVEFARVNMPSGKTALVAGFKDIDAEVRKEREIQEALRDAIHAANAASKAKSDFLSSMSHDIRTPMNGIIGMTAIAASHLDDRERVANCLQKITASSKHLLSLINEVLDMNKIESGRVELMEEEFNLSELIDNLLTMTRPQINERGHSLRIKISDVRHEKVVGDSRRVQQVFVNLMSNAIKYTPNGGDISLSIAERPMQAPGMGCYEFVFEDNGYGMTEEFQARMFEPFTRANDKQTANIQGTGLGMAITRNIVRMMGGDIRVESRYGEGSRFTVTIYLKIQGEGDAAVDCARFAGLDVLVADDDPISCESACALLEDMGMNAEWVLGGVDAVARVRERHAQNRDYYAVLLDWKMPDMDGVETVRALREIVGDEAPIVIVSAYDWADIEQEARAIGASAFIGKPLFKSRMARLFQGLLCGGEHHEERTPLLRFEEMDLSGHRVLLAEDQPINAEIAQEILRMTGLEVDWVGDGAACVERFGKAPDDYYDLIFMDIQMPNINGYQAAAAIRALDREYARRVPIVAMTANAFADDVQAAYSAGMNGHIAKPLDMNALAEILQKWI